MNGNTCIVDIGPTPCDEECVQVGSDGYAGRAVAECRRFIVLIREVLGPEPPGARLFVQRCPHELGEYHEVACRYEDGNEEAEEYAFRCEAEAPMKWTDGNAGSVPGEGTEE
jgi:hypothetical protein